MEWGSEAKYLILCQERITHSCEQHHRHQEWHDRLYRHDDSVLYRSWSCGLSVRSGVGSEMLGVEQRKEGLRWWAEGVPVSKAMRWIEEEYVTDSPRCGLVVVDSGRASRGVGHSSDNDSEVGPTAAVGDA